MVKDRFFFASAVISVLFCLFIMIVLLKIIENSWCQIPRIKIQGQTLIEVSLVQKKHFSLQTRSKSNATEKNLQKSNKSVSINELFANVGQKKITMPKINAQKIQQLLNKRSSAKEVLKKGNVLNIIEKAALSTQTLQKLTFNAQKLEHGYKDGSQSNFFQKVTAIINEKWHPTTSGNGLTVQVLAIIDAQGQFDFRMLKKSNNIIFNDELHVMLLNLKSIKFPIYKKDDKPSSVSIVFNFSTKEEE